MPLLYWRSGPQMSLELPLREDGVSCRTPKSEYLPVYNAHEASSGQGGCSFTYGCTIVLLLYPHGYSFFSCLF